jgi:anti-anti-sigma regulatory factor
VDHTCSLPHELTIYTVGEFYPQCMDWLGVASKGLSDEPLRVDAGAVEEVDAAGVQLLLSLSNALVRRQRELQLVNTSPVLSQACTDLGVPALIAHTHTTGAAL